MRQNGFEYKVKTQANHYQNLKVDTPRVQNNRKLKSYMVEFFQVNFCLPPSGFELTTPSFEVQRFISGLKGKDNFGKKLIISMP